jgi:RHS repeat-associated protein
LNQPLGPRIPIGGILFLLGTALVSSIVAGAEAPASPEMDKAKLLEGGQAPYRIIGQAPPNPPQRFVYFHLDHLGSPRLSLDESGATVSTHHYLAFGAELPAPASPDPTMNRKAFTGHERDPETGLDYMLARYYSSSLGRFMAVDPSSKSINTGDPQSWNRYAYVLNNPLRLVDVNGSVGRRS